MQCANCAIDNAPGSKFCTNCGAALDIVCAACGRRCHPAARFCGWCGASRTAPLAVVEPRGERKQATVLFADIVGSTARISGLDAEEPLSRLPPLVQPLDPAPPQFTRT